MNEYVVGCVVCFVLELFQVGLSCFVLFGAGVVPGVRLGHGVSRCGACYARPLCGAIRCQLGYCARRVLLTMFCAHGAFHRGSRHVVSVFVRRVRTSMRVAFVFFNSMWRIPCGFAVWGLLCEWSCRLARLCYACALYTVCVLYAVRATDQLYESIARKPRLTVYRAQQVA